MCDGAESHRPSSIRGAPGDGLEPGHASADSLPQSLVRISVTCSSPMGASHCGVLSKVSLPETQTHGPSAHWLPLSLKACVGTSTAHSSPSDTSQGAGREGSSCSHSVLVSHQRGSRHSIKPLHISSSL